MKVRGVADPSLHQVSTVNGSVKEEQGDDHFTTVSANFFVHYWFNIYECSLDERFSA